MQRANAAATSDPRSGGIGLSVSSTARRLGTSLSPRSTPGGFRLAATLTTAVCAICAILASSAIAARSGSLDTASTAAEQLVDVQEVRTAAVEADAIAATSFLVGGQEPPERRAAYEDRLSDATRGLAAVAQRAPVGDLDDLGAASDALVRYAGLVEQARANNRQGFPVGAAYQREASASLRAELIAPLDAVDQASRDRLNDSLSDSTRNGAIAVALLVVALIALAAASWLLWRRTRRIVNVPIAVGAALVLVAVAWTAVVLAGTGSTVRDTVDTSLRGSDALSRARTAAFDARSAESLTLINRGNGAPNEAAWRLADAKVVAALDEACTATSSCFDTEWEVYQAGHVEIRVLDDGGSYDEAVQLALDGSPVAAAFAEFTNVAGEAQAADAAGVAAGLDDAASPLGLLRWAVLVAGLVAAGAAVVGFGQRLREYR